MYITGKTAHQVHTSGQPVIGGVPLTNSRIVPPDAGPACVFECLSRDACHGEYSFFLPLSLGKKHNKEKSVIGMTWGPFGL